MRPDTKYSAKEYAITKSKSNTNRAVKIFTNIHCVHPNILHPPQKTKASTMKFSITIQITPTSHKKEYSSGSLHIEEIPCNNSADNAGK